MSHQEMPKIELRDGFAINMTVFETDERREGWVSFYVEHPSFTNTVRASMALSPAKAIEFGETLIAAAKAAGWVQPAVEVVREVEALDA